MDDSFGLGDPLTARTRRPAMAPFLIVAVAAAIAATLLGAALLVIRRGGEAVDRANRTAVNAADRAADQRAQAQLRNALVAARTLAADGDGTYDIVSPAALAAVEPTLTYRADASDRPGDVSVAAAGTELGAAVRSGSGTCFWIHDGVGGTRYGEGEPCTGEAALGATEPTW